MMLLDYKVGNVVRVVHIVSRKCFGEKLTLPPSSSFIKKYIFPSNNCVMAALLPPSGRVC